MMLKPNIDDIIAYSGNLGTQKYIKNIIFKQVSRGCLLCSRIPFGSTASRPKKSSLVQLLWIS